MAHKPKPPYTKKDSIAIATGADESGVAAERRQARRAWVNEHRKSSKQRDTKRVTNEDAAGKNLEQYILNKNLDTISRYHLSNQHLFIKHLDRSTAMACKLSTSSEELTV